MQQLSLSIWQKIKQIGLASIFKQDEHKSVDTFLISFPKCGRTWLRLMIGRAIVRHFNLVAPNLLQKTMSLESLAKFHPEIPKIVVNHDDNPQWKKADELVLSKIKYQNYKVIFLARDPRDVVVSIYFEHKKRVNTYADKIKTSDGMENYQERVKQYEGDLSSYLKSEIGSLDTIIKYYNIWAENQNICENFLLVRYEDLHANTQKELRRVLDFIGLEQISNEAIAESIDFASFENMHKMEEEGKFKSYALKPVDKKDRESYKTRKGKVGGFAEYLNQDEINYINQKINTNLSDFYGYKVEI